MGLRNLVVLLVLAAISLLCNAQEYNGPPPEKADVVYLLHAENLVETEQLEARMEDRKKRTAYVVEGASSPARTPMAEPIFIILSEEIQPESLQLYSMDVKKGNREIEMPKNPGKRGPRPRYLTYKRVEDEVYWIEANEWLENGQYCLTPRGANTVFCFEVY